MKIFPWEWGQWLIFSSSFVQCPRLSRVGKGGGGAGIYFDCCIRTSRKILLIQLAFCDLDSLKRVFNP